MMTRALASAPKVAGVGAGKYVLRVACVCLSYFVAGRLGLAVPFTSGNVSPVWPASGIALAAVLLLGYRIWPGIALGAFLVNFFSPIPHLAAVGLAVGNTLAAVTGAFLLWRIPDYTPFLSGLRDVLGLICLGALASPIVSASLGVAVLFSTHVQPWSAVLFAWFIYWLGDAMGVLLVAPLVLALPSLLRMDRPKIVELAILLTTLTLACLAIFNDRWLVPIRPDVLAIGIFPFVIWAAIRFGIGGSSTALAVIATIATAETALGSGPFAQSSPFRNSALLQLYFAVLAISGLSLAAVIAERERAEVEREELIRQQVAQEAVRESEKRLRAAFSQTYALMAFLATDGTVLEANRAALEGAGFTRDEVVGRKFWEPWWSLLPEEVERAKASIARASSGDPVREECSYCLHDGRVRFADRTLNPVKDEGGKVVMIVASGLDVTEQKELRDTLEARVQARTRELEQKNVELQKQTELVRELSGRLLKMQDEERRRIARELHDSIGQMLVAVSMNLSIIGVERKVLSPRAVSAVMDNAALVDQITREIRTISYLLHPPLLDEAGLQSALRWYVDGFAERSKIATSLELPSSLGRLSQELEISIFRIVQEALTNIHRHSGSSTATVRLVREGSNLRLQIADAGKGIPPEKQLALTNHGRTGVGIRGIRERLRQLGGSFELKSNSNGTVLTAVLPLTSAAAVNASDEVV